MIFECKSLIPASGGFTRVYAVSSSRIFENYGEGVVLAYEAGADLERISYPFLMSPLYSAQYK